MSGTTAQVSTGATQLGQRDGAGMIIGTPPTEE